jgi:diguanylate cyclase (GGDEF)-like protein
VKILVADDDAVSRSMMRRMLIQSGYEVTTATNGAEALAVLTQPDCPRLVLLDWMMPELDGPEVCKAIRTNTQRAYTYTILLTSKESKEDLIAGLRAGADDYLTKPCNQEELKARLRTGQRILQLEDCLVEAREEMRFKATHDALTLLLDRGAILHHLNASLEEAAKSGREFSIILCDVDHFKSVNDSYGHPVGDEVLKEIARRFRASVRDHDYVGRYGGEEFLIILNRCGVANLAVQAERICKSIKATPIITATGPLRVSVSAGALGVGGGCGKSSPEQVLKQVDDALYRAKHNGRDQAVVLSLAPDVLMSA